MMANKHYMALDVGEKRIGVALADSSVRVAVPMETVDVDGHEVERIAEICTRDEIDTIIVGYPRNQSGEATKQTEFAENFAKQLVDIAPVEFQDESLTSVLAAHRLEKSGKRYEKGDIDMQAAAIILQDYLETHS